MPLEILTFLETFKEEKEEKEDIFIMVIMMTIMKILIIPLIEILVIYINQQIMNFIILGFLYLLTMKILKKIKLRY